MLLLFKKKLLQSASMVPVLSLLLNHNMLRASKSCITCMKTCKINDVL